MRWPWSRRRDDRDLRALDRELERHCRETLRELRRRVAPYVVKGEGFGALNERLPYDERAAVRALMQRVDLGPAGAGVDVFDLAYGLLDEIAADRRR